MEAFSEKFEEMYKVHYTVLRNMAHNVVSDADAAHDIVQEIFLNLWHKNQHPDLILNQKAYLMKAVVNASITHLSKNKPKLNVSDLKLEAGDNSESALHTKELQQHIDKALQKLPPKCKAIFVLSRFEGVKNPEIASMLGLSIKTVENQMGIALKKMKEDLKSFLNFEIAST